MASSIEIYCNSVSDIISSGQLWLQHLSLHFAIFSGEKRVAKTWSWQCLTMMTWPTDYVFSINRDPALVRQADSANMSSLCTILLMLSLSAFCLRTWYDPECCEMKKKKVAGLSVKMGIRGTVQRAFGFYCWFPFHSAQPPSKSYRLQCLKMSRHLKDKLTPLCT